jgi:hypothetical protein
VIPVVALLAPLLASAAHACYLVTNTRIDIIPCDFEPDAIAARVEALEGAEPGGRKAAAQPQGTTPRVAARERPQSDAPRERGRGREPAPVAGGETTLRDSSAQEPRTAHAPASSPSPLATSQPAAPQPSAGPSAASATATQPPAGTQPAPAGTPPPPAGTPPQSTTRPPSPTAQPSSPATQLPTTLPTTLPSSSPQPTAPSQAASGAGAQQLVEATVAELRGLEGSLASGSTGDADPVLARAAQVFATSSPQAAVAIATAQQALARGDIYAARQAIAGAIAAATRR